MTTTLEEIHRDPAILDRAISRHERLDILAGGEVTATLLPKAAVSVGDARAIRRAELGIYRRCHADEPGRAQRPWLIASSIRTSCSTR